MLDPNRPDNQFTSEQIKIARATAAAAIDACKNKNDAGMAWHGGILLSQVGETRSRKLLGRHADTILK